MALVVEAFFALVLGPFGEVFRVEYSPAQIISSSFKGSSKMVGANHRDASVAV